METMLEQLNSELQDKGGIVSKSINRCLRL